MHTNINSSERNLKNTFDYIEEIVGQSWLENWVHGMRDNFGRLPQNVPPLALSWLKAKDELAAYALTDKLLLSESTVRLLQLGNDLKLLQNLEDVRSQIPLLKGNVEQYNTTCFRLFIAANYHQQGIKFKFSSDISQPDLTLFNCGQEIPVVAVAPVSESTSLLISEAPLAIINAVNKLPGGEGIIYIEFPLPPGFSPKQLLEKISKRTELAGLDRHISLTAIISYAESQNNLKHSMFSLHGNTNSELSI